MNIDGLGSETIQLLYNQGLVKDVADLYTLKVADLARLERLGIKSAQNICNSIEQSRFVPFEKVVFALGIRFVGETVAKKLAKAFTSIEQLQQATVSQLISVDEIGERIAESVISYFANERNQQLIRRLIDAGLQFELKSEALTQQSNLLEGKTIVISGTFILHSREEYKKRIEQHGGKNSGSVSSKTSFILAGEGMGPEKLKKAESLGITLINENDFLQLIGESPVHQVPQMGTLF